MDEPPNLSGPELQIDDLQQLSGAQKAMLLWRALPDLEERARELIAFDLRDLEPHVARAYALAVEAPTLSAAPAKRSALPALYLKRCLGDINAVWQLVLKGHTAQAATIAASLWEHARIAM